MTGREERHVPHAKSAKEFEDENEDDDEDDAAMLKPGLQLSWRLPRMTGYKPFGHFIREPKNLLVRR